MTLLDSKETRYAGTYLADGLEYCFNIVADDEEAALNRLINMNPGKTVTDMKAVLCAPPRYWEK